MDRQSIQEFVSFLEKALSNSIEVKDVLSTFRPTLEQGYCLWNLYEEFESAFSCGEGRGEALAPILSAARKMLRYQTDDTGRLFSEPEWEELIKMRGPVEGLVFRSCLACGSQQTSFQASGFTDEFSAICDACGSVLFQSLYDDRPLPACDCGGVFRQDVDSCWKCGGTEAQSSRGSSYLYFADHSWRRRDD